MNFLVIGNMGREDAIISKIAESKSCNKLFFAPRSDAIALKASYIDDLNCEDFSNIVEICQRLSIDCCVIGPEAPLVYGITDKLTRAGIEVFGPSKACAKLEGSKIFMKDLAKKYQIPTADFATFSKFTEAEAYIKKAKYPLVIKADGLAQGKGVVICQNLDQAKTTLNDFMNKKVFGSASTNIVIEEFLIGDELSYFVLTDGESYLNFATAKDYKKALDDDQGLNTGGMGSFSPSNNLSQEIERQINNNIIKKLIFALRAEKLYYKGVLFLGLMICEDGVKLLEINIRFGDPETQSILFRFKGDFASLLSSCATGKLATWIKNNNINQLSSEEAAVTIVYATKGYPKDYPKLTLISNLAQIEKKYQLDENIAIYHCSTIYKNNNWYSNGGRVINVSAKAKSLKLARQKAYKVIDEIIWQDGFYRSDICL